MRILDFERAHFRAIGSCQVDFWIVRYRRLGTNESTDMRMQHRDSARAEYMDRMFASMSAAERGDVASLCVVELVDPKGVVIAAFDPTGVR